MVNEDYLTGKQTQWRGVREECCHKLGSMRLHVFIEIFCKEGKGEKKLGSSSKKFLGFSNKHWENYGEGTEILCVVFLCIRKTQKFKFDVNC